MVNCILIADSGSTKTDWILTTVENSILEVETMGINPVRDSQDAIFDIVKNRLAPKIPQECQIHEIYFYGAGCINPYRKSVEEVLANTFGTTQRIAVESDLLGAARALCGNKAGIACILGTGSNSCLYDGEKIVQNTPALGYILGDEGGGAVLGRMFMNAIFKNPQFANIRDEYLKETKQTQSDIIQKVYREPMGNRFLATTSLYIEQHLDNPLLRQLVIDNFRSFFRNNLKPYNRTDLPVGVVGSMAFHYRSQLEEAARLEGYTLGTILKSPMEGLITYHAPEE
jgi:N-acetylglucosamine kinase-like BadF-type ATPase